MKRLFGLLALLFACATATAGPSYHVVVDTQAYAGQSGYLDFLILGQAAASPVHATLTGFSGIADDGGGPGPVRDRPRAARAGAPPARLIPRPHWPTGRERC